MALTWQSANTPFVAEPNDYPIQLVAEGQGKLIGIGSHPAEIYNSFDEGRTWAPVIGASSGLISNNSICFGNGTWVIIGGSIGAPSLTVVSYSLDGILWTPITLSPVINPATGATIFSLWGVVKFLNNKFIAVALLGSGSTSLNMIMTSPDGITWTPQVIPSGLVSGLNNVHYANNLWVVTRNGPGVFTSTDNVTWVNRSLSVSRSWFSVTYGLGKWVICGSNTTPDTSNGGAMESPDGVNWTVITSLSGTPWSTIAFSMGRFVISSGPGGVAPDPLGKLNISLDGISWNQVFVPGKVGSLWVIAAGFLIVNSRNSYYLSSDGLNWDIHYNIPGPLALADINFGSVAFGSNTFVALAGDQNLSGTGSVSIVTSLDGVVWTPRMPPGQFNWTGVVYGAGCFVAVAASGYLKRSMVSTDNGESWSLSDTPGNVSWKSVSYGNGAFVAVGDNLCMVSSDGVTWTLGSIDASNTYNSVTFGNGIFVTVGPTGSKYSIDGLTWLAGGAFTNAAENVAYGNGLFVAVGTGCRVSTDALIWTTVTIPGAPSLSRITYGVLGFVAVGGSTLAYSTNGSTWSNLGSFPQQLAAVAYGNGIYVLLCRTGLNNRIYTSIDRVTWVNRISSPVNRPWVSVAEGNNIFVAVSNLAVSGSSTLVTMTSEDGGQSWTQRATLGLGSLSCRGVAYGNGIFVVVTQSRSQVLTSSDGVTWALRSIVTGPVGGWNAITYGNGFFVAVGPNGVMFSSDGLTWTLGISPQNNNWGSVTYGNGLFVALSPSGSNQVTTSVNGSIWTLQSAASIDTWRSVTYGNGLFVAVSDTLGPNQIMTSPDGATWTLRPSAASLNWVGVASAPGMFASIANSGGATGQSSVDGDTWTPDALPRAGWTGIAYGRDRFVAVSSDLPTITGAPANFVMYAVYAAATTLPVISDLSPIDSSYISRFFGRN